MKKYKVKTIVFVGIAISFFFISVSHSLTDKSAEPSPKEMIDAVVIRPYPGENYPILPALSSEMHGNVANKLNESETIRKSYAKLDARRRNVDWFKGISELEKQKAVWPLLSVLCHYSEDAQIHALRSLRNIGDKQAVPFLLIYADYMAVHEGGSENATIHGVIHTEIANTLSALTGIEVKIDGQAPEELKRGIRLWKKWQVLREEQTPLKNQSPQDQQALALSQASIQFKANREYYTRPKAAAVLYPQLTVGMTKQLVQAILGKPDDHTALKSSPDCWNYTVFYSQILSLEFEDNKLVRKSQCGLDVKEPAQTETEAHHMEPTTERVETVEEAQKRAVEFLRKKNLNWGEPTAVRRTVANWYRVEFSNKASQERVILVNPKNGHAEFPLKKL